jgi:hypothetical protein
MKEEVGLRACQLKLPRMLSLPAGEPPAPPARAPFCPKGKPLGIPLDCTLLVSKHARAGRVHPPRTPSGAVAEERELGRGSDIPATNLLHARLSSTPSLHDCRRASNAPTPATHCARQNQPGRLFESEVDQSFARLLQMLT